MLLPIFKELKITNTNRDTIKKVITTSSVGKTPIYINISKFDKEQPKVLSLIAEILRENYISPKFPYPFYVITNIKNYVGSLNVIEDERFLPRFFTRKDKKLNVKEANVANKNKLLNHKILSQDISEKLQQIENYKKNHKKLQHLSFEGEFLERLYKKLKKV